MEIEILGSLEVLVGGEPVQPSAAKPRTLLAHLAINAGQAVTSDALIEELWGDKEISSHATTLRTYIFKLRRLLDPRLFENADPGDASSVKTQITSEDLLRRAARRPGAA